MNWLISFTSGVRALLHRQRVRRELDEEITEYLEAATAHNEALGVPRIVVELRATRKLCPDRRPLTNNSGRESTRIEMSVASMNCPVHFKRGHARNAYCTAR